MVSQSGANCPPGGDFSKLGGENLKRGEKGAILKFWAVFFFSFWLAILPILACNWIFDPEVKLKQKKSILFT